MVDVYSIFPLMAYAFKGKNVSEANLLKYSK